MMIDAPRLLHTGRLVLTPMDPEAVVAEDDLIATLHALGLIGAPLPGGGSIFAPGGRFLQLLAFTGCAVQMAATSSTSNPAGARVDIPETSATPRLLIGHNTRPPRCAHCGSPLTDWPERAAEIGSDATSPLLCAGCGAQAPACAWHWGRHAGCGRSFVFVEEVFPGEGTPLPALLDALQALGSGPWRYFYLQDPPALAVEGGEAFGNARRSPAR
jgi:hypothetical protein